MPQIQNAAATTETTAAAPKAPKAKPTKKAAKKTTAKAKTGKATKKTTKAPVARAKKEGIRNPQVRILKLLAKSSKPLDRATISAKAEVDSAFCSQYLGRLDADKRAAADKTYGFPSLITLSAIKAEKHDVDGKDTVVFSITATGRKLLEKTEKAE